MDKEKKYIVPDGEDKINKAEEPAGEYHNAKFPEQITDYVREDIRIPVR